MEALASLWFISRPY